MEKEKDAIGESEQVIYYKGRPITELSRDELIEALQLSMEYLQEQKKQAAQEREMIDFFAAAGVAE